MDMQPKWKLIYNAINDETKGENNSIRFHGPQMVDKRNGITIPKAMLKKICEIFNAIKDMFSSIITRDDFEEGNSKIKAINNAKKKVLTPEATAGFVSVVLVTIIGILLVGFGIVKVISTVILK